MSEFDPVVCVCIGVRESVIERVITDGATTVEQIRVRCGANTVCGGCHSELEELLQDYG
jgi:bacterioferritin-associated ferredoxin